MPESRSSTPRRPGIFMIAAITVAYTIAAFAIPAGTALVIIDADGDDLPNPLVASVCLLGVAAVLSAFILHVGFYLLNALASRRSGDTGEMPRIRDADLDSPPHSKTRLQVVDRAEAARILQQADERNHRDSAESAELMYLDRYRELAQNASREGIHAVSNDQN